MVMLNTEHINRRADPGYFGGAMCTCQACMKAIPRPTQGDQIMTMDISTSRELLQREYKEVMKGVRPGTMFLIYPEGTDGWDVVYAAERLIDDIRRKHHQETEALLKEIAKLRAAAAMSDVYEAQQYPDDQETKRLKADNKFLLEKFQRLVGRQLDLIQQVEQYRDMITKMGGSICR